MQEEVLYIETVFKLEDSEIYTVIIANIQGHAKQYILKGANEDWLRMYRGEEADKHLVLSWIQEKTGLTLNYPAAPQINPPGTIEMQGELTLLNYGNGYNQGSLEFLLGVDYSGKVIEVPKITM